MGVIIASREGLLHRIMFSAFTSRTAARVVGRRGMGKIPRRQPSRQMDDKGRATLGRHLFNRENSITEYWVSRTDGKAKLLAANIALGLGVAATYQYNHFSGNLDPDVQINKSRAVALTRWVTK